MAVFKQHRQALLSVLLFTLSCWTNVEAKFRIKHFVVLTLENRSFDHFLGWLNSTHVAGLTGNECLPINVNDPTAGKACVNTNATYNADMIDPPHGFGAITEQIFGGTSASYLSQDPAPMNGFAQNAERMKAGASTVAMSSFPPSSLPITYSLAQQFAVVDRWFASVPGPTQPNRLYFAAATSAGRLHNANASELTAGFSLRTLFDVLLANKVSWASYSHDHVSLLLAFKSLRKHLPTRFRSMAHFYHHARTGTLPRFSFVEPAYFSTPRQPASDNHPPHDVRFGERLMKKMYEALRNGPGWTSTLFLITYDEHGGFYDHVPTPQAGVPNPDGIAGEYDNFQFNRLGVRVPTIVVSPWIDRGTVISQPEGESDPTSQFEHSSIAKTARQLFGIDTPANVLTKRDAWAASLAPFLTRRTTPRTDCPRQLPRVF